MSLMCNSERTRRRRWIPALVLATCLASSTEADGAPPSDGASGPSVALLPIEFVDPLPEADQAGLERTIRDAFETPDLDLVQGAKVERARERGCPAQLDETCLRAIGSELGVTHVVTVEVHSADQDFRVLLRALGVTGDRSPSEVEVECPVCGIAEVESSVAAQAVVLRDRVIADVQPGRLVVEGTPEGATVRVDGRRVGVVPFESELASGEHELLVSERGYFDAIVPIQITAGAVERIRVDLEPAGEEDRTQKRWRSPVGWTALGLGLAGAGAGVGLFVLHGRPHANLCDDMANIDINGACKWVYQTQAAGIGLLVGGVVVAGVGVTLVAIDRRKSRSSDTARARNLKLGVGLGRIEISGHF